MELVKLQFKQAQRRRESGGGGGGGGEGAEGVDERRNA